jgi:uncharacterized protein GlcG (DUF336 family)
MFEGLAKVSQGAVGLSYAIAYFSKERYNVSVPLVDNQGYDLVVEKDDQFSRVQVKTTGCLSYGSYVVQIKSVRSNKTENKIHHFDNTKSDLMFVLTGSGDVYVIPSKEITVKNCITLSGKYEAYKSRL